jgi:hypothetical protein
MGVVSLSCTIPREIIRAEETSYSSPPQPRPRGGEQFIVEIVSEACFDITAEPREYFDRTGTAPEHWRKLIPTVLRSIKPGILACIWFALSGSASCQMKREDPVASVLAALELLIA